MSEVAAMLEPTRAPDLAYAFISAVTSESALRIKVIHLQLTPPLELKSSCASLVRALDATSCWLYVNVTTTVCRTIVMKLAVITYLPT